jgi:hypothetical protein
MARKFVATAYERATQMTPALLFQADGGFTWVAHTEFTLRPRFARTGVVGHDSGAYFRFAIGT